MKRVHDYTATTPESDSSPESTPPASHGHEKKDLAIRKRKGANSVGTQSMKRTRSAQAQGHAMKAEQSQSHRQIQIETAQENWSNCVGRIYDQLAQLDPQDSHGFERLNAILQELYTHGLRFRELRASQTPMFISG